MGRNFLISSSVIKEKNKKKCDDNVFYNINKFGPFIGLSDGAGSKKLSHLGSLHSLIYAEKFIIDFIENSKCNPLKLNTLFKRKIIEFIQKSIIELFKLENKELLKEYAATLLFAQYIEKYDRWIIGHIGDGVVGGIDNQDNLIVISNPENGEFSNETYFFSDDEAFSHLRIYWVKGLKGIVMFTDGFEIIFYDKKNKKLAPAIKKFFQWQSELKKDFNKVLKENLENLVQYTYDDSSLIIVQKESKNDAKYRQFKR